MILTCEYCGAELDTDKDDVCPFCGGTFQNNKDYLENKAREEEADRLNVEQKKLDIEKQQQANIASEVIKLRTEILAHTDYSSRPREKHPFSKIVEIVVAIFLLMVLASSCKFRLYPDSPSTVIEAEDPVTVIYGMKARMSKYTVMCDNYVEVMDPSKTPTLGHRLVYFYFTVENTSNETIKTEPCKGRRADGDICNQWIDSTLEELPDTIEKGASATGVVLFEVPIDAKMIELKYGDYVTIRINTLNK